jgi:hypothetical protein
MEKLNNHGILNGLSDNEFDDPWLKASLSELQIAPPPDFTQKVMEKVAPRENPFGETSVVLLLAVIPVLFIGWIMLSAVNLVSETCSINLNFLAKLNQFVSWSRIGEYGFLLLVGSLFLIALDYLLGKRRHESITFFFTL